MANELTTQADALVNTLTTGDARRMILQTIMDLRSGAMPTDRGMAIAANMKVLNDNMSAEINAAKLAYQTRHEASNFGQVIEMGRRVLGS